MESIDKKYRKVKGFLETLKEINKQFVEEEGIEEDYYSPFHKDYELEAIIKKTRDELIEFAVKKEHQTYCPNITINVAEITEKVNKKYGALEFSSTFIKNYIRTHYLKKSDKLSYEEILQEARKMLPTIWVKFGQRKVKLEDILQKNRLSLKLYWGSYSYENSTRLAAIEKLTKIVIEGESPTTVRATQLSIRYQGDELYRTHEIYGKNIVKARPYKNGKFLLWFKDEETARKVAEALIRG